MPIGQSPNVLVDSSYVMHYAISSVWSAYKKEFNVEPDENLDPMTDNEFKLSLDKRFKGLLFNVLQKTVHLVDYKKVYFVIDCSKKNIWRVDYYPEYKLKRRHLKKEFNQTNSFKYIKEILIPNLCESLGCKMLNLPNCESDDIIGIVSKTTKTPTVIISCDQDYLQIDNVQQYDITGNLITLDKIKDKLGLEKSSVMTNKIMLLIKILMGDAGDEIPAIKPKLGIKGAYKLVRNKKLLEETLSDENIKNNFMRNRLLIDFDKIPDLIKQEIVSLWRKTSGEAEQTIEELQSL